MKNYGTTSFNYPKTSQVNYCHNCNLWWYVCLIIAIEFITGLLQNAGTHIDPTKLIKVAHYCRGMQSYSATIVYTLQEIPEHLCIDKLGSSLAKLLNDYQLQVSLREGCKKILVKDRWVSPWLPCDVNCVYILCSHTLMVKLHNLNRKAVAFNSEL